MKLSIITGGTKGIGYGIAEELMGRGYTCIAASRRQPENIEEIKSKYSERFLFFPCDVSDNGNRAALIEYAEGLGGAELLVNCAGVAPRVRKDMLEITEDDWDYVTDINLRGTFFLTQAFVNAVKQRDARVCVPYEPSRIPHPPFPRIINITSVSSYTASVNRAEYCVSKAGISMLTKLFAVRLAEMGIGVFEVSPGLIETDMTAGVKGKYDAMIEDGLLPIPRMGKPKDVATCVAAIAEGYMDYCTGTVIHADGGFNIRKL